MTTATAPLLAALPQPQALIAWHALSLFNSIRSEEAHIHDPKIRADIAAVLDETGRECLMAAARLKHSPAGAETLRHIQAKEPRDHSAN